MAEFGEGAGGKFTLIDTAKFDPAKTTLREYLELYLKESGVGKEPFDTMFGLKVCKEEQDQFYHHP